MFTVNNQNNRVCVTVPPSTGADSGGGGSDPGKNEYFPSFLGTSPFCRICNSRCLQLFKKDVWNKHKSVEYEPPTLQTDEKVHLSTHFSAPQTRCPLLLVTLISNKEWRARLENTQIYSPKHADLYLAPVQSTGASCSTRQMLVNSNSPSRTTETICLNRSEPKLYHSSLNRTTQNTHQLLFFRLGLLVFGEFDAQFLQILGHDFPQTPLVLHVL